jgi:hypothetical protein
MRPIKSLPTHFNRITCIEAVYSQKEDGGVNKAKRQTDKYPFENVS